MALDWLASAIVSLKQRPSISSLIADWMDRASDEHLVSRCLAGDDLAFAELVDRYKNLVFGVISQVVVDTSRVEDLAQEAFIKIHRGLPRFRGDAKLSTWIYQIVRNVCREPSHDGPATASLDERDDAGRLRHDPGAHDATFRGFELRDELEKAIRTLPFEQRFLISAHYFGGQQYQELAEILDIPIGTVKTHLHRAKGRLRLLLEKVSDR
jgi:RNA polymerase sigma-70 factor, ECF subfamily